MKEPFVVVAVVLKQLMDMVLLIDAVVASMTTIVKLEMVVVAFHRHLMMVVSSFVVVVVVAVVLVALVDSQHVDNPFLDYYTSFVHLMMDHMMVAFHYQLKHMDAWAFALVDIVVVDDPFDVDDLVQGVLADNHDMDLALVVVAVVVVIKQKVEVEKVLMMVGLILHH
jgi:hypothetical protein